MFDSSLYQICYGMHRCSEVEALVVVVLVLQEVGLLSIGHEQQEEEAEDVMGKSCDENDLELAQIP